VAIDIKVEPTVPEGIEAVGVPVFCGLHPVDEARPIDVESCARRGFTGSLGESVVLSGPHGTLEVFVGLGPQERVDNEAWRQCAAAFVRAMSHCQTVALDIGGRGEKETSDIEVGQAITEGALLASYRFAEFKSAAPPRSLEHLVFVGQEQSSLERGVARAKVIVEAVSLVRDLVNRPPSVLTPESFAGIALEIAAEESLRIEVLDEQALIANGLGGIVGVGRGSRNAPRLVRLEYFPNAGESLPAVVLVGKGITFDSGGLSLKNAESMMTMKTDMSGAAAVLGTLKACKKLSLESHVIGFMALAENMPGGSATKPGDVLKIHNGKTIEVLNTDCEGRLVLADALSLAEAEHPDAIVDLATLTGACVVALGASIAGLMGNDDRLIEAIGRASRRAGEPTWPLPLPEGYRSHIDSEIADMKNIGITGQAGAISAALLLEEFVGTTPWAHLDIAGPARSKDGGGYLTKGGTGFGVRTLIELLENYEPLGGRATDAIGKAVL
jgi:leucyl aminopeptidase